MVSESDRAVSAIANAVLQDYGIITPDKNSLIIDSNKLHRSRFSVRRDLAKEAHINISDISAIYFDGLISDGVRGGHVPPPRENDRHQVVFAFTCH